MLSPHVREGGCDARLQSGMQDYWGPEYIPPQGLHLLQAPLLLPEPRWERLVRRCPCGRRTMALVRGRGMQVRQRPAFQVTPALWQVWTVTLNLYLMAFKLLFLLEVSHQKLTGDISIHSQLCKKTATLRHLQLDSYKEREVHTAYSIYWWGLRNVFI